MEYFPRSCDSGFEFVEHDTNQPFPHDWEQRFDLVHQRLGFAGTGPRGLEVTKEFYRMTKPDGWVQLAELVIDPAVASGAAVKEFFLLMQATFAQLGQEPLFATEKLHLWVADAGFVDIQETTVTSYRGRLNENLEMAKASIESDVVGMQGLLHFINCESMRYSSIWKCKLITVISSGAQTGTVSSGRFGHIARAICRRTSIARGSLSATCSMGSPSC